MPPSCPSSPPTALHPWHCRCAAAAARSDDASVHSANCGCGQGQQPWGEDREPRRHRGDARQKHRPCGHVECVAEPRMTPRSRAPRELLDRGIERFRGEHASDRQEQRRPLARMDPKKSPCRDRRRRRRQMHPEARLALNRPADAPESDGELVPPRPQAPRIAPALGSVSVSGSIFGPAPPHGHYPAFT